MNMHFYAKVHSFHFILRGLVAQERLRNTSISSTKHLEKFSYHSVMSEYVSIVKFIYRQICICFIKKKWMWLITGVFASSHFPLQYFFKKFNKCKKQICNFEAWYTQRTWFFSQNQFLKIYKNVNSISIDEYFKKKMKMRICRSSDFNYKNIICIEGMIISTQFIMLTKAATERKLMRGFFFNFINF